MLTACVNKFAFYQSIKGIKEILAYSFAVLEFNKLLNCGYIDIFLAHMRDVKEQKVNSTYQKGVSNFPRTLSEILSQPVNCFLVQFGLVAFVIINLRVQLIPLLAKQVSSQRIFRTTKGSLNRIEFFFVPSQR